MPVTFAMLHFINTGFQAGATRVIPSAAVLTAYSYVPRVKLFKQL